jgi:hypothetical protein
MGVRKGARNGQSFNIVPDVAFGSPAGDHLFEKLTLETKVLILSPADWDRYQM